MKMEGAYAARFASEQAGAGAAATAAAAKATPPHRRAALARSVNPLTDTTNTLTARIKIEEPSEDPPSAQDFKAPQITIEQPTPEREPANADKVGTEVWSSSPPPINQSKPAFSLPQNFDPKAYRIDDGGLTFASSPNRKVPDAPPHQKYEPHELRGIGRQCGNRLPPASAVQAMFLYEMQRQTEVEKLFHNIMFEAAQEKKEGAAQEKRIAQLEGRLALLEKQAMLRDLEQRIYRTDLRIDGQEKDLATSNHALASVEKKLEDLHAQLEDLSKKQLESAAAAASALPAPNMSADIQVMKAEVNILFGDRDGILKIIGKLETDLERLENNTRSLTRQMSNSARSSPVPTQRIPAKTSNGDLIDLTVPKGQGLSASVHAPTPPDRVRSFQPGKPWAG